MEITTTAKLTRPTLPQSGAFDYRGYLRRQGIHLLGEGNLRDVRILSGVSSLHGQLDRLRDRLEERLDRLYPSDHAGLMKGMLLGNREAVPLEREEDFRSLGLIHLLAISGLHVGVFVGCLYGILTWVGVTRRRRLLSVSGPSFLCDPDRGGRTGDPGGGDGRDGAGGGDSEQVERQSLFLRAGGTGDVVVESIPVDGGGISTLLCGHRCVAGGDRPLEPPDSHATAPFQSADGGHADC